MFLWCFDLFWRGFGWSSLGISTCWIIHVRDQLRYREGILEALRLDPSRATDQGAGSSSYGQVDRQRDDHPQWRTAFSVKRCENHQPHEETFIGAPFSQTNLYFCCGVYSCGESLLEIARFPKGRESFLSIALEHHVCTSTCPQIWQFRMTTYYFICIYTLPIPIGSMVLLYMVTCTINIPPMLAYIPAPWILWDISRIRYGKPTIDHFPWAFPGVSCQVVLPLISRKLEHESWEAETKKTESCG